MAALSSDFVKNVLEEEAKKYKSIEVSKNIDLFIDEGNLLATDINPLDPKEFASKKEDFFKSLARDNTQLLFNQIWTLPYERVQEVVVAKLPRPKNKLPREKPIPKNKPTTKWDAYSKLKGINKKKRGRKVWDDDLQKWVPRWGYQSKNDLKKDWLLEVPANADPYEDQFAKKKTEKQERVAKNELQRLKNIARSSKVKVPQLSVAPGKTNSKLELNKAFHISKKATASLGKFEQNLPKEKKAKNMGNKRKFDPIFGNMQQEKEKGLSILDSIINKKPRMDTQKAANKEMAAEQQQAAARNKGGVKATKKGGRGSNKALPKLKKGRATNKKKVR